MPQNFSESIDSKNPFIRSIGALGEDGFEKLQRSYVIVVGLGGVGSHAAMALARSGIGKIRLIDMDNVTYSSLNRHAVATGDDVGTPKAELLKRTFEKINPAIKAEALREFYNVENSVELLQDGADFVIDAIDGVNTKVGLLQFCVENDIRVISSMGASARTDPRLLRIADIGKTRVCPLARVIRKRLKRRGIYDGILTVYSEEEPLTVLPPDSSEDVILQGRVRNTLPSLAVMPAIFGNTLASIVIDRLSGMNRLNV